MFHSGEMPEWFNGAVSKTVVPKGTVGSNPTLSAMYRTVHGSAVNQNGSQLRQQCYLAADSTDNFN